MKKIDCILIKNGQANVVSVEEDCRAIEAVLGVDSIEGLTRYVDGKPYVFFCDGEFLVNGMYSFDDISAESAESDSIGNPLEVILGPILICRLPPGDGPSFIRSLTKKDQMDLISYHDVGEAIVYRMKPVSFPGERGKRGRGIHSPARASSPLEEKGGAYGKL